MTPPPQHREHLADRVQRLESFAVISGGDLADIKSDVTDIKAALQQLPAAIGAEILEYTEPVLGEIMAGRATLATRQDLQAMEQRLDNRLSGLESRLDQVLASLGT
ncbi:hypothetical protein [Nonomuraea sp. NPDC049709]|uniref:hypothetical protein n=1 Tax=Nonomuraea sp. NPDC049709 TaxID=3154736 RepID=UPI00343DBF22